MRWQKSKWDFIREHLLEWSLVVAAVVVGLMIGLGCSTIAPATGAAAGAALGSTLGPMGAGIGAFAGSAGADVLMPTEVIEEPPDDLWSLLGLIVDSAFWLLVVAAIIFWLLPSPVAIWRGIREKLKR